jgi:hypothetical protein
MAGVSFNFDGSAEGLKAAASEANAALKASEKQGEATTKAVESVERANENAAVSYVDLTKATKDATKATGVVEEAARDAARAVDDLGKDTKRAGDKIRTDFDAVEKSADKLSGGLVGDFKDISAGAAALGPVGLAVVGIGVGMTAAAGAAVAFAAEVVSLTRDATRAIEALDGMRGSLAVTDEEVNGIRNANSALDHMDRVADRVRVGLAGGFAPAVERTAILAAAMGLATIDLVEYLGGFGKVLTDVANFALSPFNSTVAYAIEAGIALAEIIGTPLPQAVLDMGKRFSEEIKPIKGFEAATLAAGHSLAGYITIVQTDLQKIDLESHFASAEEGARAAAEETERSGERISTAVKASGEAVATGLVGSFRVALPEIEASTAAIVEVVEATETTKTEIVAAQSAERVRLTQDEYAAIWSAAQGLASNLYDLWAQIGENEMASLDARRDANAETTEELRAMMEAGAESMTEAERKNLAARLAAAEQQGAALEALQRESVAKQFRAQQAASLVSIAVDTVTASVKALAELGPTAGAIAAGAIVLSGAVAAATVGAQQPPEFHDGGLIGSPRARLASDEVPITAREGEFVVNARATANNREALEAMNKGGGAMGALTIVIGGQSITDFLVREATGDGAFGRQFRDPLPRLAGAYR